MGTLQMDEIVVSDWADLMRRIPNEAIDCIITDPPYESLNKWREIGTTARLGGHRNPAKRDDTKWFATIPNNDLPDLIQECWRVLKKDCHAYIFCDWETIKLLHCFAIEGGVFQNGKPLIWNKGAPGLGYHYRCQYEFVFMLDKGKNRRLADLSVPDVLSFKKVPHSVAICPTQKPLELVRLLMRQSSAPGETVLDPFAGSGTVAAAAVDGGRHFISGDTDPGMVRRATERLVVLRSQERLPGLE